MSDTEHSKKRSLLNSHEGCFRVATCLTHWHSLTATRRHPVRVTIYFWRPWKWSGMEAEIIYLHNKYV